MYTTKSYLHLRHPHLVQKLEHGFEPLVPELPHGKEAQQQLPGWTEKQAARPAE